MIDLRNHLNQSSVAKLSKAYIHLIAGFAYTFDGTHIDEKLVFNEGDDSFRQSVLRELDSHSIVHVSKITFVAFKTVMQEIRLDRLDKYVCIVDIFKNAWIHSYVMLYPLKYGGHFTEFVESVTNNSNYRSFRQKFINRENLTYRFPSSDYVMPLLHEEVSLILSWLGEIQSRELVLDAKDSVWESLKFNERMKDIKKFWQVERIMKEFKADQPIQILFMLMLLGEKGFVSSFIQICDKDLGERYLDEVLLLFITFQEYFPIYYPEITVRFETSLSVILKYGMTFKEDTFDSDPENDNIVE